jgi:ATP-dependent Clp protease adapter protein ClpS
MEMNFPTLQMRLALPIALPLVEFIKELARDDAQLATDKEIAVLLGVFRPYGGLGNTDVMAIPAHHAQAVLRATTRLRFEIRHRHLLDLSDDALEQADAIPITEKITAENRAGMAYVFLATIQQAILVNARHERPPLLNGLFAWIAAMFRRAMTRTPRGDEPCDLWVHNDPVNTTNYVTEIFRHVLRCPRDTAERHMREVHHAKASKVASGRRDRIEPLAHAPKTWQLTASITDQGAELPAPTLNSKHS